MVTIADHKAEPETADTDTPTPPTRRHIGFAPSASMIAGAAIGVVWVWVPIMIVIFGISALPTIIGFAVALVMFVYLMRGVEWLERVRSEAVFGMGLAVPPRKISPKTGFSRWLHQLWLDLNSTRFWKGCTHHFIRLAYDMAAVGLAFALLAFAFFAPAGAFAISRSGPNAGVIFLPPMLAWPLAIIAFAIAAAIIVFAPILDAKIDSWLLAPSPTAILKHEMNALADARLGALTSAQTERYRIERDLHDSVQPRLVSLAMTIGLAQTKFDTDPAAAKELIAEAHEDAKTALLELRNVVRGIAPTILADRGLDAALSSVVQRSAVPTLLNVDLPRRIPEETESVAYFIVAEALTNVAKHAQASRAVVTVRLDEVENVLHVSVFDDGHGGAKITDSETATGLRGLAERVRAARGTFTVSSPYTGSTTITAELPCAL
ncbi:sensor histidine kinase [Mycolicibacterium moriokaense]|uniref:histidine kinase n=1 Tax=Mycolicibacterium moriokaense TaxID=39691 RepID=A0AAD1HER9_9MYCO|nr:histidine kinase [Mycolicibacterium moriokaense]MCV7042549.1 sensor domain-containing protein [Mycolicibacterium moriokaense]ORB16971.1 sensor histidine kinase [Mycolicibacterium moriokaense]BBX04087.1 sensor histidine kinase [Mycolicibacterium moriokaense]